MSEYSKLPVTFPAGTEIPVTIAGTVKTEITNEPTVKLAAASKVEVSNIPEVKAQGGHFVVKIEGATGEGTGATVRGGSVYATETTEIWNGANTYHPGQPIFYEGLYYICVAEVTSVTVPSADAAHWKPQLRQVEIPGEPVVKIKADGANVIPVSGVGTFKVEGVASASNITVESSVGEAKLKVAKNRLLVASNWGIEVVLSTVAKAVTFKQTPPLASKIQSLYIEIEELEVKEKELVTWIVVLGMAGIAVGTICSASFEAKATGKYLITGTASEGLTSNIAFTGGKILNFNMALPAVVYKAGSEISVESDLLIGTASAVVAAKYKVMTVTYLEGEL